MLARSLIVHVTIQASKLVFHQLDVLGVRADADTNSISGVTCFPQVISQEDNVFGFSLQVDGDAISTIATVDDLVIFQMVAIGPEVFSARIVTEQDANFATTLDVVILHVVVCVVMTDGDAVISRIEDPVFFSQAVFDAPAPEDANPISF